LHSERGNRTREPQRRLGPRLSCAATLEGKTLADGDLTQVAHGNRVTNHLAFHFTDGSVHDETAVFSQGYTFRLLTDHLVRKGPAFSHPLELSFDALSGRTTVRYVDDEGKQKLATERLHLPSDVANGMVFTLLKNIPPEAPQTNRLPAASKAVRS
jgi:hypothetical protein